MSFQSSVFVMERFKLDLKNGIHLVGYLWKPEGETRAYIVHSHGLGEHAERYLHVAEFFNAQGIGFVSFDHQGHGRSGGKRGHFAKYDDLLEELDLVRDEAKKVFGEVPEILYGHSFGGNILANYLIRRLPAARCALLSGPWLLLPKEQQPSPFLHALAKLMNAVFPAFTNNNQIDVSQLSTDQAVGEVYSKDPLVHGNITAGAFIKAEAAGQYAIEHAATVGMPTLVLHGEHDKITSPEGSKQFAAASNGKASLEIQKGMRHEIHNEVKKQAVLQRMLDFINTHISA